MFARRGDFFGLIFLAAISQPALGTENKTTSTAPKIKALIVDGHSNHPWWETTPILRRILESSGRFSVDVATAPKKLSEVDQFAPDFKSYAVVMMNYNGDDSVTRTGAANWSPATQKSLEDYVRGGGNLSIIHSANNSFPQWKEYQRMIGLGGWGHRNEKDGPYVYYKDNKLVRDDSPGVGGWHGDEHPFQVVTREPDHPIMRGLPPVWMHARDELYSHLRGPAENLTILATAYSPRKYTGRNVDEPMVMVLTYGKGRVFHTAMGHGTYSMRCAGFATLVQRGTEWAATGEVTIPVPNDFPTADTPRECRIFSYEKWVGLVENGDKPGNEFVFYVADGHVCEAEEYVVAPQDYERPGKLKLQVVGIEQDGNAIKLRITIPDRNRNLTTDDALTVKLGSPFGGNDVSAEIAVNGVTIAQNVLFKRVATAAHP